MNKWDIARRDLLKSLGVGAACLPLLRAQRAVAAPGQSKHLMIIQMSEGYRQGDWKPKAGSLMTQTLPFSTAPFEPHKGEMIFLPNLTNPGISAGGHGSYGVIYYGMGSQGSGQYKEPKGKTLDQVVASALPKLASGRPSLHLHVQLELAPRSTTSPGGSRCFWTGAGQPINPVGDPYAVYKEIFAGAAAGNTNVDGASVEKLMVRRKSILDYVGKSLDDFKMRLGTEDRMAVDAHNQSIRDLEQQLQSAGSVGQCGATASPMLDLADRKNYPEILKAHLALMVSSLKCGITNVVTVQTGDSSGNNINFGAFVPGIPATSKNNYKSPYRNWHDLGHNPTMDGVDHKRIVDKWFMERYAELFTTMKSVPDTAGGTLFDSTVILIGNHMQEGANHDAQKNPWMIATGKNGYFATGQCAASDGKPVGAVMSEICNALGVMGPYGQSMPELKKA
jgi:hypothetical protein